MAKAAIKYYDEAREFMRMEDCAEKTELAISRLENPYSLADESWVMYQEWLQKTGPKTVAEFTDKNRITMFPLLVKHKVIRKANITKMVDYAQETRKMDILSYLLNVGNDLRNHPKNLDIAPKFTPGKSENNAARKKPQADNVKAGDIIWLGVHPMPWLVLEKKEDKILVISKFAFDCQAYHNTFYRRKWEDCSLYSWLNEKYYSDYFTDAEKESVVTVYIDTEDKLHTEPVDGAKGSKMFILNVDEVKRYFRTEEERKARVTLTGKRKILWQHFDVYAHWWLRTPSLDNMSGATHVLTNGDIKMHGGTILSNGYDEFYDHYGVRPAMYIDIK